MSLEPVYNKSNNVVHDIWPDLISVQSMTSGTVSYNSILEPMRGEFRILSRAEKTKHRPLEVQVATQAYMPRALLQAQRVVDCDVKMFKKYRKLKKEADKDYKSLEIFSPNKATPAEVVDIVTSTVDEFLQNSGGKNAIRIDFYRSMNVNIHVAKTDKIRQVHGSVNRESLAKALAPPTIPDEKLLELEYKKIGAEFRKQAMRSSAKLYTVTLLLVAIGAILLLIPHYRKYSGSWDSDESENSENANQRNKESPASASGATPIQVTPRKPEEVSIYQTLSSNYKECMKTTLGAALEDKSKFWKDYEPAVQKCSQLGGLEKIKLESYKNRDETKLVIHSNDDKPLTIVTLGVGTDVEAEKAMKSKLPNNTEFFAADPIYEGNANIFTPIGLFFPFAVGVRTGRENAFVLKNGKYQTLPMTHLNVITFLKNMVQKDVIDWFLVDNEGAEYDLMPIMLRGKDFEKNNITVCQLNVEFHGGNNDRWFPVLKEVIEDGSWVVIHAKNVGHIRTAMINTASDYCNQRYLAQFLDKKESSN